MATADDFALSSEQEMLEVLTSGFSALSDESFKELTGHKIISGLKRARVCLIVCFISVRLKRLDEMFLWFGRSR